MTGRQKSHQISGDGSDFGARRIWLPTVDWGDANVRVGIATDHGGLGLKEELIARLRAAGHEVVDFGAHKLTPDDDYPDFVMPLAQAVAAGTVERGVAICGSGGRRRGDCGRHYLLLQGALPGIRLCQY
jgi:Ribose/Galactose Isomerase